MNREALQPEKTFFLDENQVCYYRGVKISRRKNDQLSIGDGMPARIVSFSTCRGLASYQCFAGIKDDQVLIFEGSMIGPGMLDQYQVRLTLGC